MQKLTGKTVLVTGSTDGVGRLVARRLGEAGARVLVHGRDAAEAPELLPRSKEREARRPSSGPIWRAWPRCAVSLTQYRTRPIGSTF